MRIDAWLGLCFFSLFLLADEYRRFFRAHSGLVSASGAADTFGPPHPDFRDVAHSPSGSLDKTKNRPEGVGPNVGDVPLQSHHHGASDIAGSVSDPSNGAPDDALRRAGRVLWRRGRPCAIRNTAELCKRRVDLDAETISCRRSSGGP